jgi:hypothetical protein
VDDFLTAIGVAVLGALALTVKLSPHIIAYVNRRWVGDQAIEWRRAYDAKPRQRSTAATVRFPRRGGNQKSVRSILEDCAPLLDWSPYLYAKVRIGRVLCLFGWIVLTLPTASVIWLTTSLAWHPFAFAGGHILQYLVAVPSMLAYAALGRRARRHYATQERDLALADTRPPILFLRSFRSDAERLPEVPSPHDPTRDSWDTTGQRWSVEETLVAELRRHGPVLAIGDPRDSLPKAGAVRLYVPDAVWQQAVARLVDDAAITVVRVASSAGVDWELGHTLSSAPDRTILVTVGADGVPFLPQAYADLRDKMQNIASAELPPTGWLAWFLYPSDEGFAEIDAPTRTNLRREFKKAVRRLAGEHPALRGHARASWWWTTWQYTSREYLLLYVVIPLVAFTGLAVVIGFVL